MKLAKMVSDINLNNAKASYSKDKNNVDMLRIQTNSQQSQQSNAVKKDKVLLDAMKGAI